jgi:hypothetical protein
MNPVHGRQLPGSELRTAESHSKLAVSAWQDYAKLVAKPPAGPLEKERPNASSCKRVMLMHDQLVRDTCGSDRWLACDQVKEQNGRARAHLPMPM